MYEQEPITKAALIGLGAIGSYLASHLQTVLGDNLRIIAGGARKERLERDGVPVGEGRTLAELYDGSSFAVLQAQRALSALYYAFLRRGSPRRYAVPDYRARAAASQVSYAQLRIPDAAEYASRAIMLERVRGELLAEILHLRSAHAAQLRAIRAYTRADLPAPDLSLLTRLPELAPDGLCAVLRDFGLLEIL